MQWVDGEIPGVRIKALKTFSDDRGNLTELWRLDDVELPTPSMCYVSFTHGGVTRGPHEHEKQTDIFVFLSKFDLFLWDNRPGPQPRTRMKVSNREGITRVSVPPGVVHGYTCVEEAGTMGITLNFPDTLYAGWNKEFPVDEIRHEEEADSIYVPW